MITVNYSSHPSNFPTQFILIFSQKTVIYSMYKFNKKEQIIGILLFISYTWLCNFLMHTVQITSTGHLGILGILHNLNRIAFILIFYDICLSNSPKKKPDYLIYRTSLCYLLVFFISLLQ